MTGLTPKETARLGALAESIRQLTEYLAEHSFAPAEMSLPSLYAHLAQMRRIQGNASNGVSYVACLMAKAYLTAHMEMEPFDVGLKPEGASGLDIDAQTVDGQRVVAEIKTTYPYHQGGKDLGAQQKATFDKDFAKLNKAPAAFKYFFVTEQSTFEIVRAKHAHKIPGVRIVCLTTGNEHQA
jgi:hypothetical protein